MLLKCEDTQPLILTSMHTVTGETEKGWGHNVWDNFNWKFFLRTVLAWFFYRSGLFFFYLWRSRRCGRNLVILNLHRVLPADSPVLPKHLGLRSLILKQNNLDALLKFLRKHFSIWSLSEFHQTLQPRSAFKKLHCIITFDDGYADFIKYAWPTLQLHQMPVTMFLPTALIGTSHAYWWDRLYYACMHSAQLDAKEKFNGAAQLLQNLIKIPAAKRAPGIYQLIEFLQNWPEKQVQAVLENLKHGDWENEKLANQENRLMNWDEIIKLRQLGISFGSHTRHHLNLAVISRESLEDEVSLSRQEIETQLHETIDTFSFPGGHFSQEALDAVIEAGYACACSMNKGINFSQEENRFCLKRNNVWDGTVEDFRGHFSPAMFAFNLIRADISSRLQARND